MKFSCALSLNPSPEFAIRPELELEELVAKLALVADIVAQVEVVGHGGDNLQLLILINLIYYYYATALNV